jgi:transcriptional regulator with GAF, ATPase, and Fis domain
MVGRSRAIEQVRQLIARVGPIPRPVLITGERGTGKELVARALHAASGPGARPMVVVNCAALAEGLIESELFGHEKGAFTGAMQTVPGRFEQADGGTLFLDEIGNMPLPFQQKLLRVVEYGTFTRVGGRTEVTVAVRIVSATNVDLAAKIARGEFLADLFDRLAFETIELPPLRERTEDLGDLATHFLDLLGRELPALRGKRLAADGLASLQRYSFPGNLRELKNLLERAAYRDTGAELTAADLGLATAPQVSAAASDHGEGSFRDRITALERRLLIEGLEGADGNQAEAARRLGLTYDQFRHYARKHRIG